MRVPSLSRCPEATRRSTCFQSMIEDSPNRPSIAAEINAFDEAQTHDQRLVSRFARRKRKLFDDPISGAVDSGQEVLRLAMAHRSHSKAATVRSRTDAGIIAIAPISEIVATFLAGPRMIADLVSRACAPPRSSDVSARRAQLQYRHRAAQARAFAPSPQTECPARSSAGKARGAGSRARVPERALLTNSPHCRRARHR